MAEGRAQEKSAKEFAVLNNAGAVYGFQSENKYGIVRGDLLSGMQYVLSRNNALREEKILQETMNGAAQYKAYRLAMEKWESSNEKSDENKPNFLSGEALQFAERDYGLVQESARDRTSMFYDGLGKLTVDGLMNLFDAYTKRMPEKITKHVKKNGKTLVEKLEDEKVATVIGSATNYFINGTTRKNIEQMNYETIMQALDSQLPDEEEKKKAT